MQEKIDRIHIKGKYTIVRRIGGGTFGKVYLGIFDVKGIAKSLVDETEVAIKLVILT